jgi:antibiotic biosynthesis monooxygenase (ABM) superfamily enzyme
MIDLQNYKVRLQGLGRTREFIAFSAEDAAQQWAYSMPRSAWLQEGDLVIEVVDGLGVVAPFTVRAQMEFTIT